jgi:acyl carrier protein
MTTATGFDFILDYLQARYRQAQHAAEPRGPIPTLTPDYDLIESRILDSLGFVEFILLVEEHSGQEISIDSVSREDFRTMDAIRRRFFDGS